MCSYFHSKWRLFKKLYLVFRIAYLTYLHKFTNGEVRQLEVDY